MMRWIKLLNRVLFMFFLVFIFNLMSVKALDANSKQSVNICIDGSMYQFTGNIKKDFDLNILNSTGNRYKDRLILNDLNIHNINIEGTDFTYQRVGNYQTAGYSDLNTNCYTYIEYANNGYEYTTKNCNNKYLNILQDFKWKEDKNNIEGFSTNFVNSKTGNITVRLQANGNISDALWNRLNVVSDYNGSARGKGTCKKVKNGGEKYFECSEIPPFEKNSSTYYVHIYIDGIKTDDFNENVSEEVKQGYVNSCGGSGGKMYLGGIPVSILPIDYIKIDNPAKTNSQLKNLCSQIDGINANDKLKKAYVSECYSSQISYEEIDTQLQTIQIKLDNLRKMFSGVSTEEGLASFASKNKLICTDKRMGIPVISEKQGVMPIPFESKIVYENYDGYWGMICTEDYYVDGGIPSLVAAGTGVEYNNKVQINRTCSIFQLKQVTKKTQCSTSQSYEIRCDHSGSGVYGPDETAGGPNSSFDSCVESCDGGKYTQKCINSCYKSTYSNERTKLLSKYSNMSFDFSKNYSLQKITNASATIGVNTDVKHQSEAVTTVSPGQSQTNGGVTLTSREMGAGESLIFDLNNDGKIDGVMGAGAYIITLEVDGKVVATTGSLSGCNVNCSGFVNSHSGPPGCSNNADQEYYDELAKAEVELRNLEALARSSSQLEDYSISFTDSLTGDIYKVTGNTILHDEDKPLLDIVKNEELSSEKEETSTYTVGTSGDIRDKKSTLSGISTTVMTAVYDVNIPTSHVKIGEAELVVVENPYTTSDVNKYYSYEMNKNVHAEEFTFNRYSNYNPALFTNGKNVYFTNLRSPAYNVLLNSGKTEEELAKIANVSFSINGKKYIYELINHNTNIAVTLKVGHGEGSEFISFDSTKFYCYYGVYNFLTGSTKEWEVTPEPTTSPSPTTTPSVSVPVSGLRYYYREIYLDPQSNGFGGVFPNGRNPRWNWTGTITDGVASGAANNSDPNYIVDPEKLIEDIEAKGEDIFFDESEYDYVFTMTKDVIKKIRDYNKTKINGKKITYLDFSLVAASDNKRNYSQMVNEWYTELPASKLVEISECNNAKDGKCYITR